jgi:hypothetical protein
MRTLIVTAITVAAPGFAGFAGFAHPSPATAQTVSLEVRGGLDRSVAEFRDAGGMAARGDAGFGGDILFNVTPIVSLYGGYGWDRFGCAGCGEGDWITSRGFEGGAKLLFAASPLSGALSPWIRAGVVANEARVAYNGFETTSERGVGFQVGVGVDLPLGAVLSASPAIRYQRFPADFTVIGEGTLADETVSYLSFDVGLHFHPLAPR